MQERLVVGPIATNCWIIQTDSASESEEHTRKPCIVIDPGGDPKAIIARIERVNLKVQYILLTHGHFDHLAALPDLYDYCCRHNMDPVLAIHKDDTAYLGPDAHEFHIRDFSAVGAESYVESLWKPLPQAQHLLQDGDKIGPFTVLHLPGHSPGSAAFYDQEKKKLYSGDSLFAGGTGRTDLPGGDSRALERSLQRLLALDGAIQVYPGHGNSTTIARER